MDASLVNDPVWTCSAAFGINRDAKIEFDISDVHHSSESSLWWESMEVIEEEELPSGICGKTDPMIQITTPATVTRYGISENFFKNC